MKTIQLYEMIVVRHGLMSVGQPFSGKSRSLQVGAEWGTGKLMGILGHGFEGATGLKECRDKGAEFNPESRRFWPGR